MKEIMITGRQTNSPNKKFIVGGIQCRQTLEWYVLVTGQSLGERLYEEQAKVASGKYGTKYKRTPFRDLIQKYGPSEFTPVEFKYLPTLAEANSFKAQILVKLFESDQAIVA